MMKIVNRMVVIKCSNPLNLTKLFPQIKHFKGKKLYTGRPTMISWKLRNNKTILLFPNGTIQLLGQLTDKQITSCQLLLQKLLKRNSLSEPQVKTMTVVCNLKRTFSFTNLSSTNQHFFYEPELFPALQITKWQPMHVTLFHTGKVVFTGVKNIDDVYPVIDSLRSLNTLCDLYDK